MVEQKKRSKKKEKEVEIEGGIVMKRKKIIKNK